jgi:hypothetical protein
MAGFDDVYLNNVFAAAKQGMVAGNARWDQYCDGHVVCGDMDYFLSYALYFVFTALASQYAGLVTQFTNIGEAELAQTMATRQELFTSRAQKIQSALAIPVNKYDRAGITDHVTTQIS